MREAAILAYRPREDDLPEDRLDASFASAQRS